MQNCGNPTPSPTVNNFSHLFVQIMVHFSKNSSSDNYNVSETSNEISVRTIGYTAKKTLVRFVFLYNVY